MYRTDRRLRALDFCGGAVRCARADVPIRCRFRPPGPAPATPPPIPAAAGLDRRGPCPHLASIASSALTATAAREALCGSTPTPSLRSGCRCLARQAQASHTNEVHDRSWSGAQADGAAIPCAERSRNLHRTRDGWARADEFRCAEASVKVRASPAREAAPLIRSVFSRRIGGRKDRKMTDTND
jgi:hypothetical protein